MKKNTQTRHQPAQKRKRKGTRKHRAPTPEVQSNPTPISERFTANVTRAITVATSDMSRSERRAQRQQRAAKLPAIVREVHERKAQPRMRTVLRAQGYRYSHDQAAWVEQ